MNAPIAGELRICRKCARAFKPRTPLQEHCELSCFGSDPARLIGIPQGNERSLKNLEKNSRALKAKAKKAQT